RRRARPGPRHLAEHRAGARRTHRGARQHAGAGHDLQRVAARGHDVKAQVLIVDDERLIRSSLERALASQGHATEAAESAAAALAAAGRKRFDLVILDLKLPDGSGLDVLQKLLAEAPETKIVVITAHGTVDNAVE